MWTLILVTASGIQTAGNFNDRALCDQVAKEWQRQEVKAACSQTESPDAAMQRMATLMKAMIKIME
jgi:hypothetical protein